MRPEIPTRRTAALIICPFFFYSTVAPFNLTTTYLLHSLTYLLTYFPSPIYYLPYLLNIFALGKNSMIC